MSLSFDYATPEARVSLLWLLEQNWFQEHQYFADPCLDGGIVVTTTGATVRIEPSGYMSVRNTLPLLRRCYG